MSKMIYVDNFTNTNSNKFWLNAFKKYISNIVSYDIIKIKSKKILEKILLDKPTHIHFGGSVKNDKKFPSKNIIEIRKNLPNVKITFFYGDVYYFYYHRNIIKYIDKLFMSHIPIDIKTDKIEFTPCATSLNQRPINNKKFYEVSFIGNNYSKYRLDNLKEISEVCDLTVIGKNWENSGLKFEKSISYEEFPKIVSRSKFCLGSTLYTPCEFNSSSCGYKIGSTKLCHDENCLGYRNKRGYFSNRVMNLCACGGCVLHIFNEEMEKIFENETNILFFNNLEHLKKIIKIYKNNLDKLLEISRDAYNLSRNYTFEKIAKKIIGVGS